MQSVTIVLTLEQVVSTLQEKYYCPQQRASLIKTYLPGFKVRTDIDAT